MTRLALAGRCSGLTTPVSRREQARGRSASSARAGRGRRGRAAGKCGGRIQQLSDSESSLSNSCVIVSCKFKIALATWSWRPDRGSLLATRGASPTLISSAAASGGARKRSRFAIQIAQNLPLLFPGLRFRARSKAQSSCRSNALPPCSRIFSANTRALPQRSDRSADPGPAAAYWN